MQERLGDDLVTQARHGQGVVDVADQVLHGQVRTGIRVSAVGGVDAERDGDRRKAVQIRRGTDRHLKGGVAAEHLRCDVTVAGQKGGLIVDQRETEPIGVVCLVQRKAAEDGQVFKILLQRLGVLVVRSGRFVQLVRDGLGLLPAGLEVQVVPSCGRLLEQTDGQVVVERDALQRDLDRLDRVGGGELDLVVIFVLRVVDGQAGETDVRIDRGQARAAGQHKSVGGGVIASRPFALVGQDGVARDDLDPVVSRPGIDPGGPLNRRSYRHLVIPVQGVDQDDQEITFGWQQLVKFHFLYRGRPLVGICSLLFGNVCSDLEPFVAEADVGRVPDEFVIFVAGVEIEPDLGIEREVAVVVGQPRDQVPIAQGTRFGNEVDRDHVVQVGRVVVPDLGILAGKRLPGIARQAAVGVLEAGAIGAVERVGAAVTVEEVDARSCEQVIVIRATHHAVQTGVFPQACGFGRIGIEKAVRNWIALSIEVTLLVAIAVIQHARIFLIHIEPELQTVYVVQAQTVGIEIVVRITRPGEQEVIAIAADQIVVAATGVELVVAFTAPQPVVAGITMEHVVVRSAVQPVTAVAADERVIAGTTIEQPDHFVAACRQVGEIGVVHEGDVVVTAQAVDGELFHQRHSLPVAPVPEQRAGDWDRLDRR